MSKKDVQFQQKTSRNFSYSHKNVSLNFSLVIDDTSELSSFLKCLKKAVVDVEETIREVEKNG